MAVWLRITFVILFIKIMIAFYSRGKCFIVSQSISWSPHAFHLLDDESPKWNILKHFNTKNTCLGKVKPVGILTSACLKWCIGCLSLLRTLRWHSDLVLTFLRGGLLLMQHFSLCYRMSPSEDDPWLADALNSQDWNGCHRGAILDLRDGC